MIRFKKAHVPGCKCITPDKIIKEGDAKEGKPTGSKGITNQYWITSAERIGLVDGKKGILYER